MWSCDYEMCVGKVKNHHQLDQHVFHHVHHITLNWIPSIWGSYELNVLINSNQHYQTKLKQPKYRNSQNRNSQNKSSQNVGILTTLLAIVKTQLISNSEGVPLGKCPLTLILSAVLVVFRPIIIPDWPTCSTISIGIGAILGPHELLGVHMKRLHDSDGFAYFARTASKHFL